jgi:hypothetical protein
VQGGFARRESGDRVYESQGRELLADGGSDDDIPWGISYACCTSGQECGTNEFTNLRECIESYYAVMSDAMLLQAASYSLQSISKQCNCGG